MIMLKRMQKMKEITKELSSSIIEGITKPQQAKLKANDLSNNEWETINTLVSILKPFFEIKICSNFLLILQKLILLINGK